jgi:hypothetical protein
MSTPGQAVYATRRGVQADASAAASHINMDQSIAVPPASMQTLRLPEHVSLAGAGSASQHAYNGALRYHRHSMAHVQGHPQDPQMSATYHDPQRPRGMPAERPAHMHGPPPGYPFHGYHDRQAEYDVYQHRVHGGPAADPAASAFPPYPAATAAGRKRALSPGPSMPPQREPYAPQATEGARHAPQPSAGSWQQPQRQPPSIQQPLSEVPQHQRTQAEQAAAASALGPSDSKRARPSYPGMDDANPLGLSFIPKGRHCLCHTRSISCKACKLDALHL